MANRTAAEANNQDAKKYGTVIDKLVPDLDIGGVKIPAQNFTWQLTPGVTPYVTTFWVSPAMSQKLIEKQNPVTISINFPTTNHPAGQQHNGTLKIENAYLVARKFVDTTKVVWTVADARWLLQGQQIFCVYNKTVQVNDNKSAYATKGAVGYTVEKPVENNRGTRYDETSSQWTGDAGAATSIPAANVNYTKTAQATPADLRKQFETLTTGRYIPWTVKREKNMPYTIKEIVEKELKSKGIPVDETMLEDYTYFLDNVIYRGAALPEVLEELLSMARLTLGVSLAGKIYVTSTTEYTKQGNPENFLAAQKLLFGCLYKQDKSKARPASVKVMFEKMKETMFVAVEETRRMPEDGIYRFPVLSVLSTSDDVKGNPFFDERAMQNGWVVGCINVLPLPFAAKIEGKDYTAGTYVPVTKFLEAIGISNPGDFMAGTYFNGCFERRVYNHYKDNVFKIPAGALFTADQRKIITMVTKAVKNHWRTTFMIDPYCRDRMKTWQAKLASVINNYDHHAAPSPVFCNYFYMPERRDAVPPAGTAITDWYSGAYSWNVPQDDPALMTPSPAVITTVSEPLGIFKVSFPVPLDPSVSFIGHFHVENLPTPSPGVGITSFLMDKVLPSRKHTMVTIMSVIWEVDYNGDPANIEKMIRDSYYTIEESPSDGVGFFPSWEIKNYLDVARYAYPKVKVRGAVSFALYIDALSKFIPGIQSNMFAKELTYEIVNLNYLNMLAKYEANKVYTQFRDLLAGTATLPGVVSDLKLSGNLMNIAFIFKPNSGPTTSFTLIDTVPYPSLEATAGRLSQKHLDYLRNQVSRTGDTLTYQHTTN